MVLCPDDISGNCIIIGPLGKGKRRTVGEASLKRMSICPVMLCSHLQCLQRIIDLCRPVQESVLGLRLETARVLPVT